MSNRRLPDLEQRDAQPASPRRRLAAPSILSSAPEHKDLRAEGVVGGPRFPGPRGGPQRTFRIRIVQVSRKDVNMNVRHGVSKQLVVQVARPKDRFARLGCHPYIGPEASRLLGCEVNRVGHVSSSEHHRRVAGHGSEPLQVRVGELPGEEADAVVVLIWTTLPARLATDARASLLPVLWPRPRHRPSLTLKRTDVPKLPHQWRTDHPAPRKGAGGCRGARSNALERSPRGRGARVGVV